MALMSEWELVGLLREARQMIDGEASAERLKAIDEALEVYAAEQEKRMAENADIDNGHPDFVFKRHMRLRNDYDGRVWTIAEKDGTRWVLRHRGADFTATLVREEKDLRNTRRWIWERN